jgi:hypothetical protein
MLIAGKSNPTKSNNNSIAEGVFAKKGVITGCVQKTGTTLGNKGYVPDAFVEFTINSDGYDNKILVFGSVIRDKQTGAFASMGSAGKVDQAFSRIGALNGLSDEQLAISQNSEGRLHFTDDVITASIGKPVYFISYVYGKRNNSDKPGYTNFNYLVGASDDVNPEDAYNEIYAALEASDYDKEKLMIGREYLAKYKDNNPLPSKATPNISTSNNSDDLLF